jgi:hypothetical protein
MPKREEGKTLVAATDTKSVYAGLPNSGQPAYVEDTLAKLYVSAGVAKYVDDDKVVEPVVQKEIK